MSGDAHAKNGPQTDQRVRCRSRLGVEKKWPRFQQAPPHLHVAIRLGDSLGNDAFGQVFRSLRRRVWLECSF